MKEAIARVQEHVELCQRRGVRKTVVVTGWGSHSKDGLAKIKPAIQELCQRERLRVLIDEPNVVCITLEIGVAQGNAGKDSCSIM